MSDISNLIMENAKKLEEKMQKYRRVLHQNPEIGMNLPKTSAFVKKTLNELGYVATDCGESGVLAIAGGKKSGKVFLLRGDMDALPVKEDSDVEFKSQNDFMHACGHDMHTAMLLGAAEILKEMEDEIEGTIKLMFQPGEETLSGAKSMIDAGILENPKVDAAMMVHVAAGMPAPSGSAFVPAPGTSMASSDWFEIDIKGVGGHGALPDETVDPVNVAVHTHLALQAVNSREVKPTEPTVLTVGLLQAGSTSNVIPDTAKICGTIRAFSNENRSFVHKRVVDISEGIASTFRAKVDAKILSGVPCFTVDTGLSAFFKANLPNLLGANSVFYDESKVMGSEDFSYVSQIVPTIAVFFAAGNSSEGYMYPQHHPKVCFDEKCLPLGAATYAFMAIEWLKKNKIAEVIES